MKKKFWLMEPVIFVLLVMSAVFVTTMAFNNLRLFYVELAFFAAAVVFLVFRYFSIQKDIHRFLTVMGQSLNIAQKNLLTDFPIPVFVANSAGEIVWYNELSRERVLGDADAYGANITKFIPGFSFDQEGNKDGMEIEYNGRLYTVYVAKSDSEEETLHVFYFIDVTALKRDALEYYETRPCVMIIMVDNYDELLQNSKESEKAHILGEVEYILEDFIGKTNGFMRRLDRDKFLAVAEERHIREIINRRFDVLDRARGIPAADRMQVTLSIGVGKGAHTLYESERLATQALDMALGRGGDQAAVKTKNGFEFFGGVSKGVEKRTKVKSRMVANALHELMETCDNVLVMGHRFADLDAAGAAVGLTSAARNMGKTAHTVLNMQKNLVQPVIDRLTGAGMSDLFISPEQAMTLVRTKTLLVVVDTHSPTYVEHPPLYEACHDVVVIDHHRKMVEYIDNAVIFYHEQYASSASEMVTELLQYMEEDRKIGSYEAEALLAGIMLDTKNFVMKTGVRTFEAAAYLRRLGADTVEVKKMFSDSMETYQRRARLVASAEVYRGCAIASTVEQAGDMRIAAPQAADELLGISGVLASFVMYEIGGVVNFSARSMGALNVQVIMEKLGGGGHQTMAGAQMSFVQEEIGKAAKQETKAGTQMLVPEVQNKGGSGESPAERALGIARQRLIEAIDEFYAGRE